MIKEQNQPLDVSCINLDGLRAQMRESGFVIVSNTRHLTEARQAILRTISPDKLVRLETPSQDFSMDIPITQDSFAQRIIAEARDEAKFSSCMWRQVGCVLADPLTQEIEERTHNDPVGDKQFCKDLGVNLQDLLKLLQPGERLEFCHARHAENAMAGRIIDKKIDPKSKVLGVSVDPCDHCANFLAGVRPQAVYVDFNPSRSYYNVLGLRILQDAKIPTYFVRMDDQL
jgi:deoxycytidylate deaminase